jgi:hypothetical protein
MNHAGREFFGKCTFESRDAVGSRVRRIGRERPRGRVRGVGECEHRRRRADDADGHCERRIERGHFAQHARNALRRDQARGDRRAVVGIESNAHTAAGQHELDATCTEVARQRVA